MSGARARESAALVDGLFRPALAAADDILVADLISGRDVEGVALRGALLVCEPPGRVPLKAVTRVRIP